MSLNVFTFTGNLGRDAEVRDAGSTTVCGFSVAAKSGYGDKAQTIWIDCNIWGKQAESRLPEYLKKGKQVAISGELGTREHNGKTYLTCRVSSITLIGGRDDAIQSESQPARQAAPAASHPDDLDSDVPF